MPDEVYLLIAAGPAAGRRFALPEGQVLRVGRNASAEIPIPEDPRLSGFHFSVENTGSEITVRDLDSTLGTFLAGRSVTRGAASDGDRIVAGQSVFTLHSSAAQAKREDGSARGGDESLRTVIFEQGQPLYGLLDAARDKRIKKMLEAQPASPFQSLYEGKQGEELADYAPYIVRIYPDSPLIERLIEDGWGKSWGIYLRCPLSILEVRRHFRHFLMVKDETGEEFYFRFYDPRVLRVFLPTCTQDQRLEFFGPVERFFVEDDKGARVLEFAPNGEVSAHELASAREFQAC